MLDVGANVVFDIPLLKNSSSPECTEIAGIHCIEISNCKNYLCAGAKNPNEIAVYKLPGMVPHSIGQVHVHVYMHFGRNSKLVSFRKPMAVQCIHCHYYYCTCCIQRTYKKLTALKMYTNVYTC